MVLRPCGSTERASLSDSELARSTLAAETARMTLYEMAKIWRQGQMKTFEYLFGFEM